jgi:hypothetical protein
MNGLKIIAGLGAAVILTACGSSAGSAGSAAPPSSSHSSGAATGSNGGTGASNGSGNSGGVDGANSGGTPAGAGHKPKKGIISGVMSMVGGSIGSGSSQPDLHPVPGTVVFNSIRHGSFTAKVDSNGHFSMKLPIGSYHLIGHTPKADLPCIRPAAVNVDVDENVHVEVNCIVP